MSADRDVVDVPRDAAEVVRRYRRVERAASGALALFATGLVAVAVLWLPLLQAAVASIAVLATLRVPVFRSHGSARLATDADPEAVHDDFAGPTPPVLATQWSVADGVWRTAEGAVYEVSYLFGLRSIDLAVGAREVPAGEGEATGDADLELVVTTADRPWATYAVSVDERDGKTVVDVEVASDRRYGLRRLPQWLVAQRYRDEVLAAQGYEVVEREVGLSVRGVTSHVSRL